MEDFNSLLSYTIDKFTPTGSLCYYKEKADSETPIMMPTTLLQELYTSGGTLHILCMNLSMIMMMLSWWILSMKTIGCFKQEENL